MASQIVHMDVGNGNVRERIVIEQCKVQRPEQVTYYTQYAKEGRKGNEKPPSSMAIIQIKNCHKHIPNCSHVQI